MHACRTSILLALCCGIALFALPGTALAKGGRYVFDGGTQVERTQVRAALEASTFDWNIVPGQITIHLQRGPSQAAPGQIWIDTSLLTSGSYAWAVIQHEYAHQIDFLVFTDADRAAVQSLLGGTAWCVGGEGLAHDDNGCERFATAVAWAYWPSTRNAFDPGQTAGESWLRASQLRTLLQERLGVADSYAERTPAAAGKPKHRR